MSTHRQFKITLISDLEKHFTTWSCLLNHFSSGPFLCHLSLHWQLPSWNPVHIKIYNNFSHTQIELLWWHLITTLFNSGLATWSQATRRPCLLSALSLPCCASDPPTTISKQQAARASTAQDGGRSWPSWPTGDWLLGPKQPISRFLIWKVTVSSCPRPELCCHSVSCVHR